MNLVASPTRFVLNIYLASILSPSDYGKMVIPFIIVALSDIFIDSGLKSSLIQRSSLEPDDSSTVFFTNLGVSSFLAVIFISSSHFIEAFFQIESLQYLLILVSLALVIKSTALINEARLQIKGLYARLILIELIAYLLGYGVAILLAKKGFGPFSLAVMAICTSSCYSIGLLMAEKFRPNPKLFSKKLFFLHWRFGKYLLGGGLLETFSSKIDELLLSKVIPVDKLGLFSKGRDFSNIMGIIGSKFFARPWFSVMSSHASDSEYFRKRYVLAFSFLVIGGMVLILLNANYGELFIGIALGEKWIKLSKLFNLFIISTALYYLITFNKYSLLALAKSNTNFRLEVVFFAIRFSSLMIVFLMFMQSEFLIEAILFVDIISRYLLLLLQSVLMSRILQSKKITLPLVILPLVCNLFYGLILRNYPLHHYINSLLLLVLTLIILTILYFKGYLKIPGFVIKKW